MLRRDVVVKANLFTRLSPVEWENSCSPLKDMTIFTLDDLKPVLPPCEVRCLGSFRMLHMPITSVPVGS